MLNLSILINFLMTALKAALTVKKKKHLWCQLLFMLAAEFMRTQHALGVSIQITSWDLLAPNKLLIFRLYCITDPIVLREGTSRCVSHVNALSSG